MQEEIKAVRTKIILEGGEDYIQKMNEIREVAGRTKDSVEKLNASIKELSESIKKFAELCRDLF